MPITILIANYIFHESIIVIQMHAVRGGIAEIHSSFQRYFCSFINTPVHKYATILNNIDLWTENAQPK